MKKTAETAYRVPLFDRIFPPKTIVLANGHSVKQPRSRMPLITLIIVALILTQIFSPDVFNIQAKTF